MCSSDLRRAVLRYKPSVFSARRLHRYTYADYVALEQESSTKHEFLDGEIYAMAGGSEEHSALAAEVLRALGNAVGERPCRVHTSDLRIYVESIGLATFPDGAVICGGLEQHVPSPRATALNPSVLVEVTRTNLLAASFGRGRANGSATRSATRS